MVEGPRGGMAEEDPPGEGSEEDSQGKLSGAPLEKRSDSPQDKMLENSQGALAEDPRGKRRKQAKPKRNNGLLFEATNNVNNHLDQEPGVIEENRMTVCPSPEMAWSPLGSRPPAKTEEPQTAKEDENTAAAAKWAGPITQDRNQCGTPNHQEASIQHLNCPLCQLEYPCGASLDDHIKVHHQGEGSFTCPLCGHKIQFGTQLERHMAAHSAQVANGNGPEKPQPTLGQSPDNRKFKCSECGKAFKYKHHLKEHVRIHSGEKPYECSHCKKRFSHSGSYSSHLNNKKCLPPTQESVTQPGSSPTSTVKHGSPEQSSNPSPLRLQHNNNEDQNGPGLQREQLEKHTAKNLSMHCFDTGPRSKGMDFPWNALQRVMPVDINEGPLPGIVGQKTDCLLGYLNHSNGQKSYKETMQDLQGRSGVGELQKNHNSDGCSPNSLRSRAIHQAGDIGEKHSPLSYPRGDVSGLKTHENSIVGEDITRTFPTPEHQGQDCRIPCEASDLRKLCRTNPYSPTHAQGHHSKNNNDSRNHQAKQDPWSPHAVRDLWSACSPDVKEKESVSELPRIATIDHHRLARLHSPRQPLHYPRPTSHNPLVSMDCSTSEGVQAEPLDLSLPRPSKELPLVPWTKRGTETDYAGKGDTLGDQDDLKGHPLFSRLEMKTNSFFPSSPYPFFPSLLPSSLNNFLQEQYPLLQVNSNFQGLPFLPYMTYIYGAEPSYILPSVMQDKHRPLGEFFSLTKHPEMGEDIADEELSPLRKKLKKTDEGFYSCDQCDKTFQKSSSLLRHKYEHTGKRPHQCAICQKAFKHKHHLIEHSRLHSGEKPYQCNKCGKRFSHSGSYSQHMNHRYAYCRKDEGMEFSGDCMDTPRSAEDSSGGTPSPDRNSGSSQGEFEHTHHRYRNGVSSSPSYAKNSSQELLPNVGP